MHLIESIPFQLDTGLGHGGRIGLVVLASDYTIEHEFDCVFRDPAVQAIPVRADSKTSSKPTANSSTPVLADAEIYCARVANETTITPATLAAMEARLARTVAKILPGDTLDIIAYGCTSASVVIGEERVFAAFHSVHPQARCTTPVTAAKAAFKAMGATRIGVLTPYQRDVNERVQQHLEAAGFEIPVFGSFNEPEDPVVARIDTDSISAALQQMAGEHEVDMWFVSCTSLRLAAAVPQLEALLGTPVTSSNHAMIWHILTMLGVCEGVDSLPLSAFGQLYTRW